MARSTPILSLSPEELTCFRKGGRFLGDNLASCHSKQKIRKKGESVLPRTNVKGKKEKEAAVPWGRREDSGVYF